MTRVEARTAIKSTFEEVSGGPTSDELNVWIDLEHKRLLRDLKRAIPTLYTTTDVTQTLTTTDSLALPADFETLVRLERQVGSAWTPVEVSDALTPHLGSLAFREEGAALKVDPIQLAPGTYRIVYIAKATALTADSGAGGVLLVPEGAEDIIIERVAVRCRIKLEEDPSLHQSRAQEIWTELRRDLKKRYGRHVVPGLRQVRRW